MQLEQSNDRYTLSVAVDCNDINKFIADQLSTNSKHSLKRVHQELDLRPYEYFKLYDEQSSIVLNASGLVKDKLYFFKATKSLSPKSASNWTNEELVQLKVNFVEVDTLFGVSDCCSEKAKELIAELSSLTDRSYLEDYTLRADASLKKFFPKAIFIIQKYSDHVSAVDCFVQQLLYHLGFYDDWLYAFPQRRLKLKYWNKDVCVAVPDFTVMDVVSNVRMAVVEDKNFDYMRVNSEPQLIAELIALLQLSSDSTHNSAVIGVRVNGLKFWFYRINNPDHLLNAMSSKVTANEQTDVDKLGGSDGLNFLVLNDRRLIIATLDRICRTFKEEGILSTRRNSND